jgi:aspartate/methionine/tyrosine aminotransferase
MNKSDAKLQKLNLGPDWIDLSFGEPKVVAVALRNVLNIFGEPFQMPTYSDMFKWEYQPAAGNLELTKFLEVKYSAKVVVCNGAKQALSAACVAMGAKVKTKFGPASIYYDNPYYPANPIAASCGNLYRIDDKDLADCLLITSPNNPDGRNYTNSQLVHLQTIKPMIHDAAYYTPIYLPEEQFPIPLGRIQIHSMSKSYGLSGLRIGYAVCHDESLYQPIVDYMEETTAGVSAASQQVALNIERFFASHPDSKLEFEAHARSMIKASRTALEALDPEVLTVMPCSHNSMFAWAKPGPKLDYQAAKVFILQGELFGQPGMVRLNIAHPIETINEAVRRLNASKRV